MKEERGMESRRWRRRKTRREGKKEEEEGEKRQRMREIDQGIDSSTKRQGYVINWQNAIWSSHPHQKQRLPNTQQHWASQNCMPWKLFSLARVGDQGNSDSHHKGRLLSFPPQLDEAILTANLLHKHSFCSCLETPPYQWWKNESY